MNEYTLTADVYARYNDKPPRYRLYIDDNLLTERDAGWNGLEYYVTETMIVFLEPGDHAFRLEQIGTDGTVSIKGLQLNGSPISEDFKTI